MGFGANTVSFVRDEVAKELGFRLKMYGLLCHLSAAGLAEKEETLQAVEVARCARLSGKPVQLAWTRKEEFFDDSFRPAAIVKIRSGVTEKGNICFWDYHVYFAGERGAQAFYDYTKP